MTNKIGVALILVLFLLGSMFCVKPDPQLFSELGPFEMAQTLLLVASTLIWGRLAIIGERQSLHVDSNHHTIAAFFAVLSFVVAGRETSFLRVYGAGEELEYGLKLLTTAITVPAVGLICLRWLYTPSNTLNLFRLFISTPKFFWAIASFLFILLGDLFEKKILPIQSNLIWEETFELMAYFALLVAALISEGGTASPKKVGSPAIV